MVKQNFLFHEKVVIHIFCPKEYLSDYNIT